MDTRLSDLTVASSELEKLCDIALGRALNYTEGLNNQTRLFDERHDFNLQDIWQLDGTMRYVAEDACLYKCVVDRFARKLLSEQGVAERVISIGVIDISWPARLLREVLMVQLRNVGVTRLNRAKLRLSAFSARCHWYAVCFNTSKGVVEIYYWMVSGTNCKSQIVAFCTCSSFIEFLPLLGKSQSVRKMSRESSLRRVITEIVFMVFISAWITRLITPGSKPTLTRKVRA